MPLQYKPTTKSVQFKDTSKTVNQKTKTKDPEESTETNGQKQNLAKNGVFTDLTTQKERQELLKAISDSDEELVKRLVRKEGYNTNFTDEDDPDLPTPLHIAIEKGNLKIVRYLLKAKRYPANINAENKRFQRPIWLAARKGNAELANLLVSESRDKCEVNYLDKETGMSPLYRAILSKSSETCRVIVHAGADVNMRRLGLHGESAAAETPLIKAVQLNNLGICEVLVNSLVDLQAKTSSSYTALHYAVAYRRYAIARFLLDERIKVQPRAKHGITPMTIAISEHLPAMVWILVQYGYNMDKRFQWGETPLETAIRVHSEECAMVLLRWGCCLKHNDKSKPSYFSMACSEGLAIVIKFLVDINPQYLQEKWLKTKQIPLALYKQVDLYEWLSQESMKVRPLTQLCNSKIIKTLGKFTFKKLEKLPLPDSLKEPMRFQNYFKGKFTERKYREKSLLSKECPFDCPQLCVRRQCPDIEFSDSASEFEDYTDSEEETEEPEELLNNK